MDHALLLRLNAERRARRTAAVVTTLSDAQSRLVLERDFGTDPLAGAIAEARMQRATCATLPGEDVFINVYEPDPRLVIVGAVHIAQALAPMAELTGFDVEIVDPRGAFADTARFGTHSVVDAWPLDRFAERPLDAATALVALSHTPDIDDPALTAALRAGAFYVGALGSRKSHAARLERLSRAGLCDEVLARIEGPVGLPIQALTPAEIAVSILASLVRARRAGRAKPAATPTAA